MTFSLKKIEHKSVKEFIAKRISGGVGFPSLKCYLMGILSKADFVVSSFCENFQPRNFFVLPHSLYNSV